MPNTPWPDAVYTISLKENGEDWLVTVNLDEVVAVGPVLTPRNDYSSHFDIFVGSHVIAVYADALPKAEDDDDETALIRSRDRVLSAREALVNEWRAYRAVKDIK